MGDYEWQPRPGDGEDPGRQDFEEACEFVGDILLKARRAIKANPGAYTVRYSDSVIKPWKVEDEAKLLWARPQALSNRWNELLKWIRTFDEERNSLHPDRETKGFAGRLYWGCWRQALGEGCGLEGIKRFIVQKKASGDDTCPVWGTRHRYRDPDAPGGEDE